jgi:alkaline phosphatase
MVPVFAYGPGAERFAGIYENTDIFVKMAGLLDLD